MVTMTAFFNTGTRRIPCGRSVRMVWSAKIELSAPTYVFGGLEHGVARTARLVCDAGACAVN
jgi:hypothetical protein